MHEQKEPNAEEPHILQTCTYQIQGTMMSMKDELGHLKTKAQTHLQKNYTSSILMCVH
jgi:hypothetical protein